MILGGVIVAGLEARGKISFIQRSSDGADEPPPQPPGGEDDGPA